MTVIRKRAPSRKPVTKAKKGASKTTPKSKTAARVPTVSDYMTRSPHTIGRDQTLAQAHAIMNAKRIRHLPVLDGGELVGLLSQRDLYFVEMLDATKPARIRVEEAMSPEVFEVAADAPLAEVVSTMQRKKLGCVVVTAPGKVVGVFSTVDALRALLDHLPS